MKKTLLWISSIVMMTSCKPTTNTGSSVEGFWDGTVTVSMSKSEGFTGGVFKINGGNGSITCDYTSKNSKCSDNFNKNSRLTLIVPNEITTVDSRKKLVYAKAVTCEKSNGNIVPLDFNGNQVSFTASENLTCSALYKEDTNKIIEGEIVDPSEVSVLTTPTSDTVKIKIKEVAFDGDPIVIDGGSGFILCNYKDKNSCSSEYKRNATLSMRVPEFITISGARMKFNGTITCTKENGKDTSKKITGTQTTFEATENLSCAPRYDQVQSTSTPTPIPAKPTPTVNPTVEKVTIKIRDSRGLPIVPFNGFLKDNTGQINCSGGSSASCEGTYKKGATVTFTASSTIQVPGLRQLNFQNTWSCLINGREFIERSTHPATNSTTFTINDNATCNAFYN